MATGELIKVKRRSRDFGTVHTYHADEALAAALPPLAVPRMGEESRAALRAVIDYEKPPANGSMSDCLALAEARGFCADPRDWVPDFELPGRHLPLYQPWVDWLSENGLTRFHEGNTLTFDNWDRWTPKPLTSKLRARAHSNQEWIADVVMNPSRSLSASDRALILGSISAGGQYHVVRQWQVTLIQHFLNDSSAKVREAAQKKLDGMEVLESEEMYAQALAQHLTVENGRVSYAVRPEAHSQPFSTCWSNTTFAALAQALGLTPAQLAHGAKLDFLDSQFVGLATSTGDVEVRTIIAQRLLATGSPEKFPLILFRGLPSGLRQRALESLFQSSFWNSVQEFLGAERGFLTPDQMHGMAAFENIETWLARHLKERTLPVNKRYDPLRAVALSVGKEAAQEALYRALAAGMKPDNPRLTMLRFNLAL